MTLKTSIASLNVLHNIFIFTDVAINSFYFTTLKPIHMRWMLALLSNLQKRTTNSTSYIGFLNNYLNDLTSMLFSLLPYYVSSLYLCTKGRKGQMKPKSITCSAFRNLIWGRNKYRLSEVYGRCIVYVKAFRPQIEDAAYWTALFLFIFHSINVLI